MICDQKAIYSYGLTGLGEAKKQQHKYCPGITYNCCTKDDEAFSYRTWDLTFRPKIEKYYSTYLMSLKYLLGYVEEANLLAQDLKRSTQSNCQKAAKRFLDSNLNGSVIKVIYRQIEEGHKGLGDLRKGFFCMICDAQTYVGLNDYWKEPDPQYRKRMFYNRDYCEAIVNKTILANYYKVKYVKQYLEDFSAMVSCKAGNSTLLKFEIPKEHE